jgi:2-C-methyl-D-erythritol 2,4-cyclodiphosphate synthase
MSGFRVGNGFDAHRFAPGRPLMLGGVEVPFSLGLEGHSDGDCLLHAICDALLGAAALGDMGHHFPSSDPRWKGADSRAFLEETRRLIAAAGYEVENVDATIVTQAPPIAPHVEGMRRAVAGMLGIDPALVSIKAKTTDGLGALGRGEGIVAIASSLLRRAASETTT